MSDSTAPSSLFDSNDCHVVHFYGDGNITLKVEGKLFRVHKSILSSHSETFRDMFGLDYVQPAGNCKGQDEPVTLHDNLPAFIKLLNSMYSGTEFACGATVQDCLDVIELARKYQMHVLEKSLQRHMTSFLPASAEDAFQAANSFRLYRNNLSLALAVLRFGPDDLAPWAFYSAGVQLISAVDIKNKETFKLPSVLSGFGGAFVYALLVLQQLIHDSFEKWNKNVGRFYSTSCPRATGRYEQCSRHLNQYDHRSPLYIPPDQKCVDAVELMVPRIKAFETATDNPPEHHSRWCAKCISSLKETATAVVLELYPNLVECVSHLDRSQL